MDVHAIGNELQFVNGGKFERVLDFKPTVMKFLFIRKMWRYLKSLMRPAARVYGTMHDPLEHATGIEKRELLAHLAGECDPFRIMAIKRGPGTRERPNLMPSAFNKRLIGCICHPETSHVEYMWLHQGEPKRCGCGYWFELCPVAPLV